MGLFSAAKDQMVQMAIRKVLDQPRFQRYGRLASLTLNTKEKRIEARVQLQGEAGMVDARVGAYEVIQVAGRWFVVLRQVSVSREWMQALATDFIEGRQLPLPPETAKLMAQLL